MTALLINGSPRQNGETAHALSIVENILQASNIETAWFQLGTEPVRGCCHCNRCQTTNR
jgi:multimeric flavodoxin WrbA